MSRIAVFVDAGYLFGQGSMALSGRERPRTLCLLNEVNAAAALRTAASHAAPSTQLLRIYWYDGVPRGGPTRTQLDIARLPDVKLRLGFINSQGDQKGVDSLIVTDLIDLARNKAISDALVLSGDGDLRVGVDIAQSYGVRVHLLGIHPSRSSQSPELLMEADTTGEWSPETVRQFISIAEPSEPLVGTAGHSGDPRSTDPEEALSDTDISEISDDFLSSLNAAQRAELVLSMGDSSRIPSSFDSILLRTARGATQRKLAESEKRALRDRVISTIRQSPHSDMPPASA